MNYHDEVLEFLAETRKKLGWAIFLMWMILAILHIIAWCLMLKL